MARAITGSESVAKRDASRRLGRIPAAILAAALVALASISVEAQTPTLTRVVHTFEGDVQGFVTTGVSEFRGIPFAAPPVGELRWRPPQDVVPWKETLGATQFGKTCAQPVRGIFTRPSN